MKKILVIGCPGAGKSTFAKILAKRIQVPLYHLDLIWFHDNGNVIAREIFDKKLDTILKSEGWIIDGYYPRTLEKRLQYADTVFYFDLPQDVCLEGAEKRLGRKRDDSPIYETELNEGLRTRILSFRTLNTPYIEEMLNNFTGEIIRFHSHPEIENWLEYGKI